MKACHRRFTFTVRAAASLPRALGLLYCIGGLAITACAPIPTGAPAPRMIHPRVNHEINSQGKGAFTTGAWPKDTWWRAFGDEELNRLVARALAGSPDLAAARARITAARAAVRGARSRLLPHVGAEAGLEGEYFSATGEHSLLNGRSVLFGRVEPVQAVYDPDISGQNAHKLAAAVGEVRVSQAQRAAARLGISTALVRTWFGVAELDGALSAEGRRLALTKRLYGVQKARLAAGLTDADGVFAARQALAELGRKIRLEEGERTGLLAAVAALAGQSPATTVGLRPQPPALRRFPVPEDLPIGLLRHRPAVIAALWRVEAARQDVDAAHAAFYPRLNLALFAGWNSIHVADLLNPGNLARGIGLTLSLPIFEGGALRARLEGARARYRLAVDHYNGRVLEAVKEVAAGLAAWRANREALAQARSGVAAAKGRVRVRAAALRAGLTNALPSVMAGIAAAEEDEHQARQRASAGQSWVDLVAALGGGYRDRHAHGSRPPGDDGGDSNPDSRKASSAPTRDAGEPRRPVAE